MVAVLEVDSLHHVYPLELVGGPRLGPEYYRRGNSGARWTRGAVKPLRCRTRSMVCPRGGGQTLRAFSLTRMAVAPTDR